MTKTSNTWYWHKLESLLPFVPGFCQGVTRVFISYPFDYVRVFLQKEKYKNTAEYIKSNGIKNMYRGVKYPLSIIPIDRAISFKVYEDLNKKFNPFTSSLLVSLVTCTYNVPLQSINTNYILKNSNARYFSFIGQVLHDYRSNFLFRSYFIEYSRLVIGSTVYMGIYGHLRKNNSRASSSLAQKHVSPSFEPTLVKFISQLNPMFNGVIANMASWTIMYPLDTIRVEHSSNQLNIYKTVQSKYQQGGIRSFYKGIGLVYLRTIPSAGLGMIAYEKSRLLLRPKFAADPK